ncbi:MAG: rubrerythrin family protein, partial [Caldiserica bacterium]|nr:rubrerythrin family protein [Caldisericota bacterium]
MINETAKAMSFYADERGASRLYAYLAGSEKDPSLRVRFAELARVENLHTAFWRAFLLKRGITTKEPPWFSFAWARFLRRVLGRR